MLNRTCSEKSTRKYLSVSRVAEHSSAQRKADRPAEDAEVHSISLRGLKPCHPGLGASASTGCQHGLARAARFPRLRNGTNNNTYLLEFL